MKLSKVFIVTGLLVTLAGCSALTRAINLSSPYVGKAYAEQYAAYCAIADKGTRLKLRDEMQKALDDIGSGLVAPKFDCNNNGIADIDE
jgi:hypothetical protein